MATPSLIAALMAGLKGAGAMGGGAGKGIATYGSAAPMPGAMSGGQQMPKLLMSILGGVGRQGGQQMPQGQLPAALPYNSMQAPQQPRGFGGFR
jgi:hypothetical protein